MADSSYFTHGINILHKFSCACNAVCLHVTCMVITVDAVCEGLSLRSVLSHKKCKTSINCGGLMFNAFCIKPVLFSLL